MYNEFDWSHAFTGRLSGLNLASCPFANGRLPEITQKLSDEISSGNLPSIDMDFAQSLLEELPEVLEKISGYRHMVLLGIGGSALGARALQKAFFPAQDRPGHDGPWLWIADNVDASGLDAWLDRLDPADTVCVVVSKSGGTIETLAQYFIVKKWLQDKLPAAWQKHLIVVTDARKGMLRSDAILYNLAALPIPALLGGRYSVFSAVGMLPAAFMGMDWKELMRGAIEANMAIVQNPDNLASHPAWKMAVWNAELMARGYSQLIFFSYVPAWNYFGAWFAQLWAESLGKNGKGSMPVPAVGVTDQHSLLQMFLDGQKDKACFFITADQPKGAQFPDKLPGEWSFLAGKRFGDLLEAESIGTRMAMLKSDVPLLHLHLENSGEYQAGRLMGVLMASTLITGWLLGINPVDQPAVEAGKRLANAFLGAPGLEEEKKELQNFISRK